MGASPALVGRDEELTQLCALLDTVAAGRPQVAVLVGEPGIGKTRLARELLGVAADRGFRILEGRAFRLEQGLAYAPLLSALDPLAREGPLVDGLPQLARLFPSSGPQSPASTGDPALERTLLYEAVVRLVERAAAARPTVLFVDDAHWADPASLELLHYMVRRLSTQRVLVLLARRNADLDAPPALGVLLASLRRLDGAVEVAVRRLGSTAVTALAARMLGGEPPLELLDVLRSRAAGTPLAVEGLVQSLVESGQLLRVHGRWVIDGPVAALPASLRDLALDRLDRLDVSARGVCDAVAVGGDGISYEVLGAVTSLIDDQLPAAIRTAEAAGILAERIGGRRLSYHLTHPLLQEAAYEALPELDRRRLHAAMAAALERLAPEELGSLARHYRGAGPEANEDRALEVTLHAADQAQRAYATSETAAHLEAALTLVGQGRRPELLAELLGALGEARSNLGQLDQAADAWTAALAQRERQHDSAAIARLRRQLALCEHDRGRFDAARTHLDAGLAALAGQEPSQELADLYHARVVALAPFADRGEVVSAAAELLAIARRLGTPKVTVQAHLAQLVVDYADGMLGSAYDHGLAALHAAEQTDDAWLLHRSLSELCFVGWSVGNVAAMRSHVDAALAVDRRIGAPALEAQIRRVFVVIDILSGHFAPAVAEGDAVVALARRAAPPRTLATNLAFRAWALVLRGDLAQCEADLAEAEGVFATEPDNRMYLSLGVAATLLALEQGDVDRALAAAARYDPAARGAGGLRSIVRLPTGMALLAEARVPAGDPTGALALAEELERMGSAGSPLAAALASRTYGQALVVLGRPDAAAARLTAAGAAFSGLGLRWEAARADFELAGVTGDPHAARQALDGFTACGAPRWAERARTLLKRLGGPVPRLPRPPRPRSGGLSDRELEVARLVAEGMTNAEIAHRLVVSQRTVTSHLDHIYTRLGIGSRAALAAHLSSTGLLTPLRDT